MTGVPIYPCELLGCPPCVWHCEAMYYQPYPYWYQEPPPGLYNCGEPPAGAPTACNLPGGGTVVRRGICNQKLHEPPCAESPTSEPAAEPDVVICV